MASISDCFVTVTFEDSVETVWSIHGSGPLRAIPAMGDGVVAPATHWNKAAEHLRRLGFLVPNGSQFSTPGGGIGWIE